MRPVRSPARGCSPRTTESKAVIDDAAAQLGVEPEELSDALKQGLKNRIDDAVDDGRLTEEQAERLKERIDASEYPGLGLFGRGHHHMGFGFGRFELLESAASYLGLTEAELREQLEDNTLAEIAEEQGKTSQGLVNQLVATQTKRIDEAVGRRPDHRGAGDGAQGGSGRADAGPGRRRASSGRRPRVSPVLARLELPARATAVRRTPRLESSNSSRATPGSSRSGDLP